MDTLITLRDLSPTEVAELVSWLVELPLLKRYGATAASMQAEMLGAIEKRDRVTAAVSGGEVVGFSWVVDRGGFGRGSYLRLFAVRPDRQRDRLGERLLEAAEESAKFQKSRGMFLLVSDFNVDARRFYERFGYQFLGMIPHFAHPEIDECIMWKPFGG